MFSLHSPYKPSKAQLEAIDKLEENAKKDINNQILLGVTGSGKTFVMANLISRLNKPTLVLAHNKTLAAQLYQEYRDFFPDNAVEYFVSYYDYYQPESYIPSTDMYIEKDSSINDEIDKLRLSTSTSLMTRKDVIVVASVSCIYNLGSPIEYQKQIIELRPGMKLRLKDMLLRLTHLHYERSDFDFKRGTFRVKGDTIDIHPAYQNYAVRIELLEDKIRSIKYFDPISGKFFTTSENLVSETLDRKMTKAEEDYIKSRVSESGLTIIYPAKHYIAPEERFESAIKQIEHDLQERVADLNKEGKTIEAYRLSQRTNYDLEMIREIGYCKGIENYSRYFDGRNIGDAPYSLLDFFPKDYLLVVDESHITIPQIRGMYNGDRARKGTLVDYGFRLPSALDNRPLKFDEFERRKHKTIYTSATPGEYERNVVASTTKNEGIVELIVRPTGIIDPEIIVLPTENQIEDLEKRIREKIESKSRVLVTTLTKRMSEELSNYLKDKGYKVAYLHSDIETLERSDILDDLRKGEYDVLVGINLLREGIDLPEVSLVAILDADKEGFLRSETSLIQTMGRAARHISGQVVMYADNMTDSMKKAMSEVDRRRAAQIKYNEENNIKPTQIVKPIRERILEKVIEADPLEEKIDLKLPDYEFKTMSKTEQKKQIKNLESKMKAAANLMEFELAAKIRDKIKELKQAL